MNTNTVVVAGASAGIGAAIVDVLLANEIDVVAIGRDPRRMAAAVEAWSAEFPARRVDGQILDLATPESLPAYESLLDRYDELAGLVVVAGSGSPTQGSLLERHESSQKRNVVPVLMSLSACESRLRQAPSSSVVLISSIAGTEYIQCPPEYAAAKASLHAYASHWARALAPVRVNVVAAGNIDSEASVWHRRRLSESETLSGLLDREVTLRRLGETAEIAAAAHYLLSDASSFITGSVLRVDGGQARSW